MVGLENLHLAHWNSIFAFKAVHEWRHHYWGYDNPHPFSILSPLYGWHNFQWIIIKAKLLNSFWLIGLVVKWVQNIWLFCSVVLNLLVLQSHKLLVVFSFACEFSQPCWPCTGAVTVVSLHSLWSQWRAKMGSFNKVLYFECVRGSTGHFRQGDCFDTRPGGRDMNKDML